jgi:hypothetical protein
MLSKTSATGQPGVVEAKSAEQSLSADRPVPTPTIGDLVDENDAILSAGGSHIGAYSSVTVRSVAQRARTRFER